MGGGGGSEGARGVRWGMMNVHPAMVLQELGATTMVHGFKHAVWGLVLGL